MNDTELSCFLSAAETKNFSATARYLAVTQQTVSRSIKKLEEELGFALFTRNSSSMQLTAGGRIFFRWASQFSAALDEAHERFFPGPAGSEAPLRVGLCDWCGLPSAARRALDAIGEDAAARAEYRTGAFSALADSLRGGQIDILLLPEPAARSLADGGTLVSGRAFCSLPLFLHARAGTPVPEAPWLHCSLGRETDEWLRRTLCGLFGVSELSVTPLDRLDSVYTEVMLGGGWTVGPENLTGDGLTALRRPLPDAPRVPICAVRRRSSAAAALLAGALEEGAL